MSKNSMNRHFICTREEAKKFIAKQTNFWTANCECKIFNTNPNRVDSMDICLFFNETNDMGLPDIQKISKEDVLELMIVAKQSHMIMKAFRNLDGREPVEGICFCSHECFGYFKEKNAIYDKGQSIEKTDFDQCSNCGVCINICDFHARTMENDRLKVDLSACYGCGLCADVCPMECIDMVARKAEPFNFKKRLWIPKIFLLVMCLLFSTFYLTTILQGDKRLVLGEVFLATLWISFVVSFLFRKYVAIINLLFNLLSLAAYYYCWVNFTYSCGFAYESSFYLIIFIFLPVLVITTTLFFVYSRQPKLR